MLRGREVVHKDGKLILRYAWYDERYDGRLMTQNDLLNTGWTKATIRKRLGEPDCYGFNPRGGSLVRLYSESRVYRAKLSVVK